MKRTLLVVVLATLAATGCSTLQPATPAAYTGPTATVTDSFTREGPGKAQMFVLAQVDGRTIETAVHVSRRASTGWVSGSPKRTLNSTTLGP